MRVVVAGAGIIGILTAWELRHRGVEVVLVDPTPAHGATRAAAGMLAPVSEVQYGQTALYPLMLASAAEYPRLISELSSATDLPLGYRDTETLVVGADQADADALRDLHAVQQSLDMDVEAIGARQARTLEPALSPRLSAAYLIPGDHQVDPRLLTAAALDALTRPSVAPAPPAEIIAGTVTAVDTAAPAVVLGDGRTLAADAVVLATGLHLDEVAGLPKALRVPLRPVYGDILRLRTPARLVLPGEDNLFGRTIRGVVHGVPAYLVPRADGGIVLGATSREDDLDAPSTGGAFRLLRDASTLVPALLETELVEIMARARPGTPDDLPAIGSTPEAPGVVISTGYFRHGILLAPLGARLTADLVTGVCVPEDEAYLAAVSPRRFGRRPATM